MYTRDTKERKQMFINLVSGSIYCLLKVAKDGVHLKKEGTDKVLVCPGKKFEVMFVPFEDSYTTDRHKDF